jgi:DNA ligase (NAD+)
VNTKEKISELAEQILMHKRKYYAGEPIISDADYDQLEAQLSKLAPEHPVLKLVGAETSENEKASHNPPMLSLAKTYDFDELMSWVKDRDILATLKLDGVALSVVYVNGAFHLAKTRGNGIQGEDVTQKIRWVDSCLPRIDNAEGTLEVRGELYCSETQFSRLFNEMESLGLEKPSNPRNIVAGVLGRKQYAELARFFEFSPFEVVFLESGLKTKFRTDFEKFNWLKKQGFKVGDVELLHNKDEIQKYLDKAKEFMTEGDVGIDGVVFSYNDLRLHEELGATSHHPRYKMSFKWQGQTARSHITSFKWLTSRFGAVTPVAVIEPVVLSGAKITNVTLHNASYVKLFNLKIGDEIEIIRSGEVIPKFLRVSQAVDGVYALPKQCPSCHGSLAYDDVRLLCYNSEKCPAQHIQALLNWISSAEIDSLSIKRLQEMLNLKLVHHVSDLYKLEIEDLLKLPLTKEKMAKKLYDSIQKTKHLPLVNFLTGLGINGMGKASWELVLETFETLEAIQKARFEEIIAISGFAEKTANQLITGMQNKRSDIEKLFAVGVHPSAYKKKMISSYVPLKGQTFVITGALSRPREEIEKIIEDAGGKVVGAVSKKITAVITEERDSTSAKAKKARELGIPFWSELQLSVITTPKASK